MRRLSEVTSRVSGGWSAGPASWSACWSVTSLGSGPRGCRPSAPYQLTPPVPPARFRSTTAPRTPAVPPAIQQSYTTWSRQVTRGTILLEDPEEQWSTKTISLSLVGELMWYTLDLPFLSSLFHIPPESWTSYAHSFPVVFWLDDISSDVQNWVDKKN